MTDCVKTFWLIAASGLFAVFPVLADGAWIPLAPDGEPNISASVSVHSSAPSVTYHDLESGRVFAVWEEVIGGVPEIYLRYFDCAAPTSGWQALGNSAAGTGISGTAGHPSRLPRVAVDGTGKVWVVWQEGEGLDSEALVEDLVSIWTSVREILEGSGTANQKFDLIRTELQQIPDTIAAGSTSPSYIYAKCFNTTSGMWEGVDGSASGSGISGNDTASFAVHPDIVIYQGQPFVVWSYVRVEADGATSQARYDDLISDPLNNFGDIYGAHLDAGSWSSLGGSFGSYANTVSPGISASGFDPIAVSPRIVSRSSDGAPVVAWQQTFLVLSVTTLQDIIALDAFADSEFAAIPQAHLRVFGGASWDALDDGDVDSTDDANGGLSRVKDSGGAAAGVSSIDLAAGSDDEVSLVYTVTSPQTSPVTNLPVVEVYGKQWRDTDSSSAINFSWTDNGGQWRDISGSPLDSAFQPALAYNGADAPVVVWVDAFFAVFGLQWDAVTQAWHPLGNSTYRGGGLTLESLTSDISAEIVAGTVNPGLQLNPDIEIFGNGNPMTIWQRVAMPDAVKMQAAQTDFEDPSAVRSLIETMRAESENVKYDIWLRLFNRAPVLSDTMPLTGPVCIAPQASVAFSAVFDDPDGDALSITWDFGDGSQADTATPSPHQYVAEGRYFATVTVADSLGATASASWTIKVGNPPEGTIDFPFDGDEFILDQDGTVIVTFEATVTDADGDPLSVRWNLDGGVPAISFLEDPGDVLYSSPGVYDIALVVADSTGLVDTTPNTVRISVVDADADNNPPNGLITMPSENQTISSGQSLTFGADFTDPEFDGIAMYSWDFGGGADDIIGNSETGAVIFNTPGTFTVSLTVTDDNFAGALTDPTPDTVVVTVVGDNLPPDGFISSPVAPILIVPPGSNVTFAGSGTDPDGNLPLSYIWAFDGATPQDSDVAVPGSIALNVIGSFDVTFTVTDGAGLAAPEPPGLFLIVDHAPEGTITMPPSDQTIVVGGSLQFAGEATDLDGHDVRFLWLIDGVPVSTKAVPDNAFSFNTVGSFDVTLHVIDEFEVPDQSPQVLTVTVQSEAIDTDGDGIDNLSEMDNGTDPALPTLCYAPGWNLITWARVAADGDTIADQIADLPLAGSVWAYDEAADVLFPVGSVAVGAHENRMLPGNGYWAYFLSGGFHDVTGSAFPDGTRVLNPGWNLAGGIDGGNIPENANIGILWGWRYSAFVQPDAVRSNQGYWVHSTAGTDITIQDWP